jgi:hypothetical protein
MRRPRRLRPTVDHLEPRSLLAVVAVVDSGVDPSIFPAGSILTGFDATTWYTGAHADTSPRGGAFSYHGTSMAGVILAHDPTAKILPIVVCDAAGNVNMEDVGSTAFDGVLVASLEVAGVRGGALVVCAAGDYGADLRARPVFPAADNYLENVVSVGAAGPDGRLLPTSDRGLVDYAAPGSDVTVTLPGGGRAVISGTSVAATAVSGEAARILDANPGAGPLAIRKALQGVYPVPAGSTSTVFARPPATPVPPGGGATIHSPFMRRFMRRLPIRPPATPVLPAWFHPRRLSALVLRPSPTPVPLGGWRP